MVNSQKKKRETIVHCKNQEEGHSMQSEQYWKVRQGFSWSCHLSSVLLMTA